VAADDSQRTDDAADEALACPPCRGTGRVISGLGGEPHEVACPWCEGTGRFLAGHDAQAARRAQEGDAPA
jgi:DnaJ-class molecular chaperone